MKILIVNDHAVLLAGIRLLLQEAVVDAVCDEAGDGCAAMRKVRDNNYDVVILDLTLSSSISGFEVLEGIKREKPFLPVVVISMHPEEQHAVKAYSLGVDGYINKKSTVYDLNHALETVTKGGKYVAEHLRGAVVSGLRNVKTAEQTFLQAKPLSKREKQIAQMLSSGITNKEIAWQLAISVKTISTYKTRILNKLNLKNLAQLVKHVLVETHTNYRQEGTE